MYFQRAYVWATEFQSPQPRQALSVGSNFMKTTYIQFDAPNYENQTSTDGLLKSTFKKLIVGILTTVIPKANPDFEDKIKDVKYWLVELHIKTGIPQREIGLDKTGQIILKMPFNDNYGFWTDNNLLLDDFKKSFQVSEISKTSFEEQWELFDRISDFTIEITEYTTLSTGTDGGHIYLTTEIEYQNAKRKLVIYFADKSDEQKLKTKDKIRISGRLLDEGKNQSLSLLDTELLN